MCAGIKQTKIVIIIFTIVNRKRMTAAQALDHPWLKKLASTTDLSGNKAKLKRYVIKKRWIKAVNTIIALRRMGAKIDCNLV